MYLGTIINPPGMRYVPQFVRPTIGQAARHGSSGRVRGVAVGEARVQQQQRRGRQPHQWPTAVVASSAKGPAPSMILC